VFTGNGKLMGSEIPNTPDKVLMVDAVGENTLKKEIAVKEDDPSFWYVRVTQLDNPIAWSSPVWYD